MADRTAYVSVFVRACVRVCVRVVRACVSCRAFVHACRVVCVCVSGRGPFPTSRISCLVFTSKKWLGRYFSAPENGGVIEMCMYVCARACVFVVNVESACMIRCDRMDHGVGGRARVIVHERVLVQKRVFVSACFGNFLPFSFEI